ncbi:CD209 antigen-like protein A [Syngnathoides biaculeatus]|uniref:CD209 antigen-like protein A n=1 Tax=Syngnathoides biaculeatus TaxID=300417 RepID=UPI002ADE845E|nr:CD209 antigen-like protein A [Syngnathoides biaculeatus]
MVRFDHTEVSVQMDYVNMPRTSSQGETDAVTGRNVYRLVAVIFGLLCILQAALNISLRLTTCHLKMVLVLTEATAFMAFEIFKGVVRLPPETRWDRLQVSCNPLHSASKIKETATEGTCTNSSQALDELKKKIKTIDSHRQQGWLYFPPSLYYISSTQRPWSLSRADCLQRHADLVVVNSREEQAFIVNFNMRVWIGLQMTKGTWKWVDGSQLTESYWTPGEPNNFENAMEDCVQTGLNDINSWNDVVCREPHFWICEKVV